MTRVLAAIDNSAAARPVLAMTTALATVSGATPQALYVHEPHARTPRPIAEAAGVEFHQATGDVVEQITTAAEDEDVIAVVVGVRSHPTGRQPAGHVALALLTRIAKPLVVVPPNAQPPRALHRMVLPLDGTTITAQSTRPALALAGTAGLEVIAIHVFDEDRIPAFTDQPQHETQAFAEAFCARCALEATVQLELRVGIPADEILAVAAALHADLLALAWSQGLEPGRAQTIKQLLAHSSVPLLLLPVAAAP